MYEGKRLAYLKAITADPQNQMQMEQEHRVYESGKE